MTKKRSAPSPSQTPLAKPTRVRRADGEVTQQLVLDTALALFRLYGVERTTMRDIAAEAGLSLGAAYHYFASKDALVLAYYKSFERTLTDHIALPFAAATTLRDRLAVLLHGKLDLLRQDRKLLGALFRSAGDPESPLSVFGEATLDVRTSSIGHFVEALRHEPLPEDARAVLAQALWLAHLGILLFFINDPSPQQTRTRALVDGLIALVADALPWVGMPAFSGLRARILEVAKAAGLLAGLPPLEVNRSTAKERS